MSACMRMAPYANRLIKVCTHDLHANLTSRDRNHHLIARHDAVVLLQRLDLRIGRAMKAVLLLLLLLD